MITLYELNEIKLLLINLRLICGNAIPHPKEVELVNPSLDGIDATLEIIDREINYVTYKS